MKFCEIMLCCGILCVINALCLVICSVIMGWWVEKVLFIAGANCIALAVLTCD